MRNEIPTASRTGQGIHLPEGGSVPQVPVGRCLTACADRLIILRWIIRTGNHILQIGLHLIMPTGSHTHQHGLHQTMLTGSPIQQAGLRLIIPTGSHIQLAGLRQVILTGNLIQQAGLQQIILTGSLIHQEIHLSRMIVPGNHVRRGLAGRHRAVLNAMPIKHRADHPDARFEKTKNNITIKKWSQPAPFFYYPSVCSVCSFS